MPDIYPNQTGQIFAQSTSTIMDRFEKQQKEHQDRARLDAAYSTIAEQLGFDKNYIKTTSLEQKQGLVQGKQMAATLEHLKNQAAESRMRQQEAPGIMERLQLQNAQLRNADAEAQYQRQQHTAQAAWQQEAFGGDYNGAVGGEQPPPSMMGMIQAGGRTGYNVPVDDMMRALRTGQGGGAFDPTLTTRKVTMGDGSVIEVPVGQTSATGAHFMPQLVPKNAATRDSGEGPKLSKDGKFFWSAAAQEWKPMHATTDIQDALDKILHPDKAEPNATKLPGGILRFRRNAKGELEQY